MAGIDQAEDLHTCTAGLSESVDETIHQAVQFDATAFPTGRFTKRPPTGLEAAVHCSSAGRDSIDYLPYLQERASDGREPRASEIA